MKYSIYPANFKDVKLPNFAAASELLIHRIPEPTEDPTELPGDDLHSRLRRTSVNLTTLTILPKLNNSRPRVPAAADELLFSGGFLAPQSSFIP